MALPLIPLIATGIGLAQNELGHHRQQVENQRNRRHDRDMSRMENQFAIDAFNRTNEYNHPVQQMQRLREAGLNPNLVYGKGAENTASMSASGRTRSTKGETAKQNPLGVIENLLLGSQMNKISAETDNLHKQNAVLAAEETLKRAQTWQTLMNTKSTEFDLNLRAEARRYLLEDFQLRNRETGMRINKLGADTQYTLKQNLRADKQLDLNTKQLTLNERKTLIEEQVGNMTAAEKAQNIRVAEEMLHMNIEEKTRKFLQMDKELELMSKHIDISELERQVLQLDADIANLNIPKNSPAYVQLLLGLLKNYAMGHKSAPRKVGF